MHPDKYLLSVFIATSHPAEHCHTPLRLYTSTRPNTVSCCLAWCPRKLSCVAATWSSCRPSSKRPAKSRKRARRPLLICVGTAPQSKSPLIPRSIDQTSTEVWLHTVWNDSADKVFFLFFFCHENLTLIVMLDIH